MIEKLWLGTRAVAMTVLFPGTVTVYIPYRLLDPVRAPESWSVDHLGGLLVGACGVLILLRCIWEFASVGKGTLAPFDETRELVIGGLYRYLRNPMYVGVLLILLGESWFFISATLLGYTGLCFLIANVLVLGYEEPRLRYKYGQQYRDYCRQVGRWIPGRSIPTNRNHRE